MTQPEFELLEDTAGGPHARPTDAAVWARPRRRAAAVVLLVAVAAGAGFGAGRWTAPAPAAERVTATPPARFDHVFSWPGFRDAWIAPGQSPSSAHPFSDLGVGHLATVLDDTTGRLVAARWGIVQAPASNNLLKVLAVRTMTVDGHDAVQVDLTGRQTAPVVVGSYGAADAAAAGTPGGDALQLDSTVAARLTRIDVDGEVWDVWGSVTDSRELPDPSTVGAADYERFLRSVVVH